MSKHDDLVRKLKEIFQIDRPELDFGVYRILNARSAEVNDYLENGLKTKVAQSLAESGAGNLESLQKELAEKIAQYRADGMEPDAVPKVKEIKQKIADLTSGSAEHENAVFTHLLTFFSRYYDKGDFISQRRFKGDTYAIPYGGEEVILHWANKEQYYTKSGENFSNFSFKLSDGRTVEFRLLAAEVSKDNRKDSNKDRCFTLIEQHARLVVDDDGNESEQDFSPINSDEKSLVIRFVYQTVGKGVKQEALVVDAVNKILSDPGVRNDWIELAQKLPTEKNPQRTLLEKCLTTYVSKNTSDYFIHKDLAGFLKRELDFYIKNEVMHLDDVQEATDLSTIQKSLRQIQVLRSIANDLISFLGQLEEFQKHLWVKKKFVVSTSYCITLDRVPKELYSEVVANTKQWDQWGEMRMLKSSNGKATAGTISFLEANPYLMIDTSLYDLSFKAKLLSQIDNLDEMIDGLLVQSDNFQALNLLEKKYSEQVKCVYIDPPYNTSDAGFVYKNQYKHSSWLSLINTRVPLSVGMLRDDGVLCCAIDDLELPYLQNTLDSIFGFDNRLGNLVVEIKPSGRTNDKFLATSHEYILFYAKEHSLAEIDFFPLSADQISLYSEGDGEESFKWRDFLRTGGFSTPEERPNSFYPIYYSPETGKADVESFEGSIAIEPLDSEGKKRVWRKTKPSFLAHLQANEINFIKNRKGDWKIQIIDRIKDGIRPKSIWVGSKYDASSHGTKLLKSMFGESADFSFPKSVHAVKDTLFINVASDKEALVVDYFAGSGTTGHALLSINRDDGGSRKYILIEQGEYFDTVTKPRMQRAVFSADWKDGRPTSHETTGISQTFKVIRLESYEDTLNNLQLSRDDSQQSLLNSLPEKAKVDYLLKYMLNLESRSSLITVSDFSNPFNFKLKVAVDSAGAYEERNVDLVETFNYLLGLKIRHFDLQPNLGFATVTGISPAGEKTLILWRDVERMNYEELDRLCQKLAINPADSEFDVVYINGDHNIPSVFLSTEAEGGVTKTLKIRQIEPEFMALMFNMEA